MQISVWIQERTTISFLLHLKVLSSFSHVWLFATLWSITHQTPLSIAILQARILEGVAMPSSRGSSRPRDWTHVSCWSSRSLATSCEVLTHWKRLWCWEGLGAGGERDDRGWDGWMASLTRWTWVWVNSGSWWWTGRPGVLRFMGSQRVGHDWATELNWALASPALAAGSLPLAPLGSPTHSTQSVWMHMCVCMYSETYTHMHAHTQHIFQTVCISQAICGLCLKVTQQAPRKRRAWSKKLYISSHFFKHWKIHLALRNE